MSPYLVWYCLILPWYARLVIMRPMRNISWLMLHIGSGFVMKLIIPSMMAIVIIVSPVLIFVLYFIFFVLLVFFYVCIFFLHLFFFLRLYIFYTLVLFSTRVVFPGWGVCFSRFGSGFFLLVMFFHEGFVFFTCFSYFFMPGWALGVAVHVWVRVSLWGLGFWGWFMFCVLV